MVAIPPTSGGDVEVAVFPPKLQPPEADRRTVELPPGVRRNLGLPERTWTVADELNHFTWPGFDLARTPSGDFAWGQLPAPLHARFRAEVLAAARDGRLGQMRR